MKSNEVLEQVAEYLDELFGRVATDGEIQSYIKNIEDKNFDQNEAELKGN